MNANQIFAEWVGWVPSDCPFCEAPADNLSWKRRDKHGDYFLCGHCEKVFIEELPDFFGWDNDALEGIKALVKHIFGYSISGDSKSITVMLFLTATGVTNHEYIMGHANTLHEAFKAAVVEQDCAAKDNGITVGQCEEQSWKGGCKACEHVDWRIRPELPEEGK